MPSPHRRIGLVVDEPVEAALDVLRRGAGSARADATLARQAVFEGAALEAIRRAAAGGGGTGERAGELIARIRELLPQLELPDSVLADLVRAVDRSIEARSSEERRGLQLGLLESPNPYGEATLRLAEQLDELELLPS